METVISNNGVCKSRLLPGEMSGRFSGNEAFKLRFSGSQRLQSWEESREQCYRQRDWQILSLSDSKGLGYFQRLTRRLIES